MTGRSTANLLTRATAILAAAFMTTSVLLVVMHNREHAPRSITRTEHAGSAGRSRGPGCAAAANAARGTGATERAARALSERFAIRAPRVAAKAQDRHAKGFAAPHLPLGCGHLML